MQLPNKTTKIVDENPWGGDEPSPLHDRRNFWDGFPDRNEDYIVVPGYNDRSNPDSFLSLVCLLSPFYSE
jgi:hypothetical protein